MSLSDPDRQTRVLSPGAEVRLILQDHTYMAQIAHGVREDSSD